MYAFLAQHCDEPFYEEMFADLYAATDGLEAGVAEILADEVVVALKASLGLDPLERYAESLHTQ